MNTYMISMVACFLLFGGMLASALIGYRMGCWKLRMDPGAKDVSTGNVDAVVLSLLGLLIAFTFSSAYSRFDARRQLIVAEANAIGTTWLRLDLLPTSAQPELRVLLRDYTQSRLEIWRLIPQPVALKEALSRSSHLQKQIWSTAIAATQNETGGDARKLLLPSLNDVFDLATTREVAAQAHPPLAVFLLLGILAVTAAWLTGFEMAKTGALSFIHLVPFSMLACLALFVILDIEYPRYGWVTLDGTHQLLMTLVDQMK